MADDRIPLHRHVAVVREETIAIRPARSQMFGSLAEILIAVGAVLLIVFFLDSLPIWLLMALLLAALLLGPIGLLGLIFGAIGAAVLLEAPKQSVRWQQGFLGLGIGTTEMVPFWRIDRFEVRGDFDQLTRSGERDDLAHWEVLLVKDNGKELIVGSVIVPRPLAAEGADRANRLAQACADRTEQPARLADIEAMLAWDAEWTAAEAAEEAAWADESYDDAEPADAATGAAVEPAQPDEDHPK